MKLNQHLFLALLGLLSVLSTGTAQASIITYTNRATFLGLLQPGYYEDTMSDVTSGSILGASSTTRSGNGYSVTYTAPTNGLYSITGSMSTMNASDNLVATLSANSYAVGGYFYLVDFDGAYQAFTGNNISAVAANGVDPNSSLSATNSATNFFGWISTTPITSVTINAGGVVPDRWNTVTDVIVGAGSLSSVPEPGTLALLLLGSAIGFAKRRSTT
ncbi:MAG: PEP-CTERM sorting domain-containing protein [Proteobacteria bacterium]|nr:PEP-CTERM sorting domain-containing protein [Pseudomonadota bacterium]